MTDFLVILRLIVFHLTLLPSTPVLGQPKNILILGGNGLIGGHTVRRLHSAGHRMTLIHRGNRYWDWPTLLDGHIQRTLHCDRKQPLYRCEAFENLMGTKPNFDVLLDFSGFTPNMIDNVIEDLYSIVRHYIFISTDSVYEVSAPKTHDNYSRETDAVRPPQATDRMAYAIKDHYAESKMRCEERLTDFARNKNISVLSLRLPDVLGPRDSTLRLWAYMTIMDIAEQSGQVLLLPAFASYWPISFVYVEDIARLINTLASNENVSSVPRGTMEPVNFANPEPLTLHELLKRMAAVMKLKSLRFQIAEDPTALVPRYLIPSVTRGPIDVSRAQKKWKFVITPWEASLKTTVLFYQQHLKKIRAQKLWKDPVILRLYDNLIHLEGLRIFTQQMWQQYLRGELKRLPRPKQEL